MVKTFAKKRHKFMGMAEKLHVKKYIPQDGVKHRRVRDRRYDRCYLFHDRTKQKK